MEGNNKNMNFWYEIGYTVGGPIYKGLFEWLKEEAFDSGKKVYFISGPGFNLYNLFAENGYTDAVYLDLSDGPEQLEKKGAFNEDALFFDCDTKAENQRRLAEIKKELHIKSRDVFYYPGILNSKEAIGNLRGRHYKTFLFDFWNNYELQGMIRECLEVCSLFFSGPDKLPGSQSILDGIRDYVKQNSDKDNDEETEKYSLTGPLRRLLFSPTDEEAKTIGDTKRIAFITEAEFDKDPSTPIPWKRGLLTRSDISHELKEKVAIYYDIAIPGEASQKDLHLEIGESIRNYDRWIRNQEKGTISEVKAEESILFSVIVPVYNVKTSQLRDCIDSILGQTYGKFELILVEDCSTQPDVVPALKEYENRDKVKIIYRKQNGNISVATNDGIEASKGDFIVFIDCDDIMDTNALNEFALKLKENPELDFIYTDEDKITEEDKIRHMAYFKPDWSPDLYFSMNYTNHLSAFRASIAKQTGGLRTEYNGSQDYDFTLRFLELTDNKRIGHIPKILYHWRERRESVAYETGSKSYAVIAAKKAKEDAIKRRGLKARLEFVQENDQYRIVYEPSGNPLVSIVIPSKDHLEILRQCIDSIDEFTSYRNYEIIVVDNGSKKENVTDIRSYLSEKGAGYIYGEYPFNFSLMCNKGAAAAKGEYILFLNDDIEVFRPEWLERLLGQAMQPHTGAVGAKLYYPGTTIIQHGGVINRENGPGHLLFREEDAVGHYFGCNRVDTDCIAVTGACLMVSKDKFTEAGGFDEKLPIAYNDVALCYRILELGYYNVLRNDVVAYHHESLSRGTDQEDEDKLLRLGREYDYLLSEFPEFDNEDPFLNPNLATYGAEIELRDKYEKLIPEDMTGAVAGGLADIDEVVITHNIMIKGWSFIQGRDDNSELERYLLLEDPYGRIKKAGMCRWDRGDVKKIYPNESGALMSGFVCLIKKEDIRCDLIPYHLGVETVDKDGTKIITWCGQRTHVMRDPFPKKQYCKKVKSTEIVQDNTASDNNVIWGIDSICADEHTLCIEGFAFVDEFDHFEYETIIELFGTGYTVQKIERADVAAYYPSKHFLYYTGFRCVIDKDYLPPKEIQNEAKTEIKIRLKKKFEKGSAVCIHTGKYVDR